MTTLIDTRRETFLVLALAVGALLLTVGLGARLAPSDAALLFGGVGMAVTAIAAWWGQARWPQRLKRSALAGGGWVLAYWAFVSYQDHPWFAGPETGGCDGPCFGWYTFEFSPPYLAMAALMGGAAALGAAARARARSAISNL